jgi:hypothetical protein
LTQAQATGGRSARGGRGRCAMVFLFGSSSQNQAELSCVTPATGQALVDCLASKEQPTEVGVSRSHGRKGSGGAAAGAWRRGSGAARAEQGTLGAALDLQVR